MRLNVPAHLLSVAIGFLLTGCSPKVDRGTQSAGRPPTQVVAVEASVEAVAETLPLVGSLLANEMVEIKPEVEARVEEIEFKEGEHVKQGQLLIQMDETKLGDLVREAEANFELSKASHQRNKELYEAQLISPQEYDQSASRYLATQALLALSQQRLKDTRIYAPFDGVMGARNVSPGQVVLKNTILSWLVDLDPMKVELQVPERFLGQLRAGQRIDLAVAAYPSRTFVGELFFISPYVDPDTRTALVKARIPDPEELLKPGMFANVELRLQLRDRAVVIPDSALARLLEGDQASVFVVDENDTAQLRMVTLGVRLPGRVEIVSGLQAGERVIVEGVQKIGPGAKVKLAPAEAAQPYETKDSTVLSPVGG